MNATQRKSQLGANLKGLGPPPPKTKSLSVEERMAAMKASKDAGTELVLIKVDGPEESKVDEDDKKKLTPRSQQNAIRKTTN